MQKVVKKQLYFTLFAYKNLEANSGLVYSHSTEYIFVFEKLNKKFKTCSNFKLGYVTASSGTAISTNFATSTCLENFVKNSFKFDVALKHAQDKVPARKSTPEKQKPPLATNKHRRRQKRRPRRIHNTILCQSLGDIHYYSKGNQCSRCSPEYPCGVLCGN